MWANRLPFSPDVKRERERQSYGIGQVMKRFDKYTVQALGFLLIAIGILLFILGLLAPPYSLPPCAYPGCPLPWYWWIPGASFISGIGLIIAGIILLVLARRMKPKPKTDLADGPREMNDQTRVCERKATRKAPFFSKEGLISYFFS